MTTLPEESRLRDLLDRGDAHACDSVKRGVGGPFAAGLFAWQPETDAWRELVPFKGNAVFATGMASAHAEDQALRPDGQKALKRFLSKAKRAGEAWRIVMISTAESCPACHSKIEIVARRLVTEGLLPPGGFILAFGASYADSREVGGFNDAVYHADLARPVTDRAIPVERTSPHDLPDFPGVSLRRARGPVAAVIGATVRLIGRDQRRRDWVQTPELSVLRGASAALMAAGVDRPWDLQRATLITTAAALGPLAYAECQWANIGRILLLPGTSRRAHEEAPDLPGPLYRAIVDRPYNGPAAAIRVIAVAGFANRAQHLWAERQAALSDAARARRQYNGLVLEAS